MPNFLNKLKKKIVNEIDDAKDFTTKKAFGGYDLIKDIATRPNYQAGGSKLLDYLSIGSDLGTGAFTSRFADPVRSEDGNLRAQFSKESFLQGATSLFGNTREWRDELRESPDDRNSFLDAFNKTRGLSKQYDESNLPRSAKVFGEFALDPTMYIPAGTIGNLSSKFGLSGTKFGKAVLGAKGVGATSRSARIGGALLEGGGRATLGMAAGASVGDQLAYMTPWGGDDAILPFVGAGLGMKAVDFAGGQGFKQNVIRDDSGDVFRDLATHIENERTLPNVAPGNQWKSVLKSKGVTEKEMKWNGLDDEFFSKGKISKQDVLNKIKEQDFDVEEIILDESRYDTSAIYRNYTVPGGDKGTYREILLRQKTGQEDGIDPMSWSKPTSGDAESLAYIHNYNREPVLVSADGKFSIMKDSYGDYYLVKSEGFNQGDWKIIQSFTDENEAIDYAATMNSGKTYNNQWDYPQANRGKDILAHIRVDDRDNGRTLFVHEIQSDWAQENRTGKQVHVTHKNPPPSNNYKKEDLIEEVGDDGNVNVFLKQDGKVGEWVGVYKPNAIFGRGWMTSLDEVLEYLNTKDSKWLHPFQDNWQELALKRILRYAAENGYDKVQIATGDQTLKIPGMQLSDPDRIAGRKKSYDEMLPNKLNDIAKKFGLKVTKEKASVQSKPIAEVINYDEFRELIRDNKARIRDEWGDNALTALSNFSGLWQSLENVHIKNMTLNEIFDIIYEGGVEVQIDLATKIARYFNMPFSYKEIDGNPTVHITPEARGLIRSKPQTMFSVAGDEQVDPNAVKRAERKERLARGMTMQEWEAAKANKLINPEGSLQGPPPFEGNTKFMTVEEKAAQRQLASTELGNITARAIREDQEFSLQQAPTRAKLHEKIKARYISAAPIDIPENIPTSEMPTFRQHLESLMWGPEDPSIKPGAEGRLLKKLEAQRERAINKARSQEFGEPTAPPLGNWRLRAEELMNELPPEILEMQVSTLEVADLLASVVKGRDVDNILAQRAAAAKRYRESLGNQAATINRDSPPPGQFQGKLQATSRTYNDRTMQEPTHFTEVQTPEQVMDAIAAVENATTTKPPTPPSGSGQITFIDPEELRNKMKWLSAPRNLADEAEHVKTWNLDNPIIKAISPIMNLVNPSVLMNTKVGRLIVARQRQQTAIYELSRVPLALFDQFAGSGGIRNSFGKFGTVWPTDDKGIVKGLNMHWNDVIANYKNMQDKLTPQQYKYAELYNEVIDDLRALRTSYLLSNLPREIDGKLWVPRTVSGIDEIEIIRPTNHSLDRMWELATDGARNGVDYADPRETLSLYIRATYDDILKEQFAQEMIKITLPLEAGINPAIVKRLEIKNAEFQSTKTDARFTIQQARKNKDNPDLAKIAISAREKMREAYKEMKKAQFALDEAKKKFLDQETNKSYIINDEGIKQPVGTFKINRAGERIVDRRDEQFLRNYIGAGGLPIKEASENFLSKSLGTVGRVMRTTSSTMDFATPFIHTLPIAFNNPKAWTKALAYNFAGFLNPKARADYIVKNISTINEMAKYNLSPAANEYYEAIGGEGDITRGLNKILGQGKVRKAVRETGKQTIGRFEAGMSTNLLVARTEMWKSLIDDYYKVDASGNVIKDNRDGLAQFIRNITGAIDSKNLMLSKGQRDQESFWLAFSPKLVRSTFALGGMALKPTTQEGRQALKALSMFTAGAFGLFYFSNLAYQWANGNEVDPLSEEAFESLRPDGGRKFLSVKTDIGYIGIGGQMRAAMSLLYNTEEAIRHGDFENFRTWDQFDNPILNWYLGRGAPGIQMLQDTIEVTTGLNANPYRDVSSPSKYASEMVKSFMPFFGQNMLESEDMKVGALMNGISSFGPRYAPFTNAEIRDNKVRGMGFMKSDGTQALTIDDLNRDQKRQFYEKYPVEQITKEDNVTKMFNLIDEEEASYQADINQMYLNVKRGLATKQQFKDWYKQRTSEKFDRISAIKDTFNVMPANRSGFTGSVTEYINSKNTRPEDQAVSKYYSLSSEVPLLPDGTVDFDGIAEAKDKFLKSLSPEIRQYVDKMTNIAKQVPDNTLVTEYDTVKELTKPYWDSDARVFEYFRQSSGFFSKFATYEAYQDYINQTAAESGITPDSLMGLLESKVKDVKVFEKIRSEYKRIIRLQNPFLDRALVEWYGLEPANRYDYILSGYGSDAGTKLSPLIAQDKSLNNASRAAQFGLALSKSRPPQDPLARKYSLSQ